VPNGDRIGEKVGSAEGQQRKLRTVMSDPRRPSRPPIGVHGWWHAINDDLPQFEQHDPTAKRQLRKRRS
jgi:hypothetical protein